jgi:Phosphodiester glycosidase
MDRKLIDFLRRWLMRKIGMLSFILGVGGMILTLLFHILLPSLSSSSSLSIAKPLSLSLRAATAIQYQVYSLPQADVHTLLTATSDSLRVSRGVHPIPAISLTLETVEQFAQREEAIASRNPQGVAILNAGFFDPSNQKSTSYITLNRELVADPRQNERLMENPDLLPYLDRILNRTELRHYQCQQLERFDLARHLDPSPANCEIVDAIGGGPQLLPDLTLEQEGFFDAQSEVIRDPLGSRQRNARTAVGLMPDGRMLWVMVAQKPDLAGDSGMTLAELAEFMKTLGVEKAMNLDGGSSSSLYYDSKAFYGKVNEQGERVERSVKSVLLLKDRG